MGGIGLKGMAGIDSALWDIRGKVLNVPVWELLGGKSRDRLRLYWSHCGTIRARSAERLGVPPVRNTADLEKLAEEVRERGFTALKTNTFNLPEAPITSDHRSQGAGDLPPDLRRNAEHIVGTFRRVLGPDVGIALDVAFRFKLGGAIKLAQALEPYDLMWLE